MLKTQEQGPVIEADRQQAAAADSTRYAQLSELLQRPRLRMRFPQRLEQEYRLRHARGNAVIFRSAVFYVLVLYLILGLGLMALMPAAALGHWPLGYSVLALVILGAVLISRVRQLDARHQQYVTALAFIGMAITVVMPHLAGGFAIQQASTIGVIHAAVVIGAMLGLRFIPASLAMWAGGYTGVLALLLAGRSLDWLLLHQTLTAGCGVGTVLAWLMERNSRQVFLQQSLLALEKARSDELAERMSQMSREDGLTGLANRRHFDEVLHREWQRCMRDGSSLSLMFIDVDFFKPFNDHYGHQHGDDCLMEMGKTLQPLARRPGDLAARYGGEEFVMLYPQTGPEGVRKLAEEVRANVEALKLPHAWSKAADHVTISVGTASVVPEENQTPEALVKAADHALYRAKDGGRNRVESAAVMTTA